MVVPPFNWDRGRKNIPSDALEARRLLHVVRRRLHAVVQMEILSVATKAVIACSYAPPLVHEFGGGKHINTKSLQNMHALKSSCRMHMMRSVFVLEDLGFALGLVFS